LREHLGGKDAVVGWPAIDTATSCSDAAPVTASISVPVWSVTSVAERSSAINAMAAMAAAAASGIAARVHSAA